MTPAVGFVAAAFGASLVGTPHCIGMCGPLASAAGGTLDRRIAYHLGRGLTYATLGALAGAMGHVLIRPGWVGVAVVIGGLVALAATVIGWLPPIHPKLPGLAKWSGRALRMGGVPGSLAFGLLNGLLPCGLLYAALAIAIAAGTAPLGALVMAAFWAGTVPGLTVLTTALDRLTRGHPWVRGVLAVGLLALTTASLLGKLDPAAHAHGAASTHADTTHADHDAPLPPEPACH